MPFISVIPPGKGDVTLEDLYRKVSGPAGQVDQVLQIHSLRPHTLAGHMGLYKAVMHHHDNDIPAWFLEAIGVYVSRINGCDYCDRHHTVGMSRLLGGSASDYDRALDDEPPGAPFTKAEQTALKYSAALTANPSQITEGEIKALRDAGWNDGQILEINQAASYFAYANRTVSGLGVETEGETLGFSPADDNPGGWKHG